MDTVTSQNPSNGKCGITRKRNSGLGGGGDHEPRWGAKVINVKQRAALESLHSVGSSKDSYKTRVY